MMMTNKLVAVREFLQVHTREGDRLLCAVSGGLDSMCLLYLLAQWAPTAHRHVLAGHFNHQLRPTAGHDEDFVRNWCETHNIPFISGTGDVRAFAKKEGLSLEEAARDLRYSFLRETAKKAGCPTILTAHHADDNAETMLLNLVRGTGLKGLCGIPDERNGILRPLLQITRAELAAYAATHQIPHVEDETNLDSDAAARNLLRLQVMPLLKQLNPRAVEHMSATSRQLRKIDQAMDEDILRYTSHVEVQNGRVTFPWRELETAPIEIRPKIILQMLDLLGTGRKDVGTVHLHAILDMAKHSRSTECCVNLPHNVTARYCHDFLILEKQHPSLSRTELVPKQSFHWGRYTLTLLDHREGTGLALCPQALNEDDAPVFVGQCHPGDRLFLPGSNGSRSIKRLCMDRHISLAERDLLPAVYVGDRLAAVWRLGVDTAFLPEDSTCRFVQIIQDTEEKQI